MMLLYNILLIFTTIIIIVSVYYHNSDSFNGSRIRALLNSNDNYYQFSTWKLSNSVKIINNLSSSLIEYLNTGADVISYLPIHSKKRTSTNKHRGLAAPAGHYHERLYHHNFSDHTIHRHSWSVLEEVDGIKNKEVVMLVTSTMVNEGVYLRERIIASSRTWMRLFANVVVIVEDTFNTRWAMRHCIEMEYPQYTAFECHNEPMYLLSRKCTNAYYGADGPCCKLDDGLNFVANLATDLFPDVKFLLHGDDDVFWRADQTLRWLAAIKNSGISDVYPLVANAQNGDPENHGVWHIKGCDEIHTTGWYQPLMLNHIALQKLRHAVSSYGIKDICKHFDVTHDVGFGVFAWMMELIHIKMPGVQINDRHEGIPALKPEHMAVHYIKHHKDDACGDGGNWPTETKFMQNVVIGCGDLGQPSPGHDGTAKWADMYDVWQYYEHHGQDVELGVDGKNEWMEEDCVVKDGAIKQVLQHGSTASDGQKLTLLDGSSYSLATGEVVEKRIIPRLVPLTGYDATDHAKANTVSKNWVAFKPSDCTVKGKIG